MPPHHPPTTLPYRPPRLAILRGGQSGMMLLPECIKLGMPTAVLDPDPQCSCAAWCSNFVQGDFRDYNTVWQFGQTVDCLTIVIEQVNADALADLQAIGKQVYPQPGALKTIQDKGLQKQFYAYHQLPTANFRCYANAADIKRDIANGTLTLPLILQCPADISPAVAAQAEQIAIDVLRAFDLRGVLAVELFLSPDQQIYINEVAPRPHNSGHHSIESCITSQYEQHLRSILGLPLGSTALIMPAVMLNLLGSAEHQGTTAYQGLSESLAIEGAHLHLYGKRETRPFRKMGHATITAPNLEEAKQKAQILQNCLEIVSA
ncbi:MAG: ATP-grasp domain-containing protein [Sphingobacteriales bacterium]|nr:ATP-grasp domain-containing protein [Sphingobacteriales bacterium]